jgi:hypothetical protein
LCYVVCIGYCYVTSKTVEAAGYLFAVVVAVVVEHMYK